MMSLANEIPVSLFRHPGGDQRMTAYYNEIDPFAAAWLAELIKAGHIAPGEVDTRSIEDVTPNDLAGFVQCHFFAGIAVWSYALRRAGWPDDRPVWTGSCPCQPFSAAGKGKGFADERHLWPAWFHLISQRRPGVIFGEQVAAKDGRAWLNLVQTDLEGVDYTCGAVDTCSAGFGAPHIRQRLYWVANAESCGSRAGLCHREQAEQRRKVITDIGSTGRLGDTEHCGCQRGDTPGTRPGSIVPPIEISRLANANNQYQGATRNATGAGNYSGASVADELDNGRRPGPVNGHWGDADWLFCRDGKWRATESGTFPLVNGAANRVGRLRGYGNAINAIQAESFIKTFIEAATVAGAGDALDR